MGWNEESARGDDARDEGRGDGLRASASCMSPIGGIISNARPGDGGGDAARIAVRGDGGSRGDSSRGDVGRGAVARGDAGLGEPGRCPRSQSVPEVPAPVGGLGSCGETAGDCGSNLGDA